MKKHSYPYFLLLLLLPLTFCLSSKKNQTAMLNKDTGIAIANLADNDVKGLETIRQVFAQRNPGYDLTYFSKTKKIPSTNNNRILFVQEGGGTATLSTGENSKYSVGDIIVLKPNQHIQTDSLLSALVFIVPTTPPTNIPTFIRPDWDENITDTPGGCATETNAYRRILLTWKDKVGPYLFHSLNAHRVRIMDSFSHYHPKQGGFDEFYLVQMVQPAAKIITSNRVDLIEHPENMTKEQAADLLISTPLKVGDLLYLPRGVMHRGVGGVLAQVITVPGFIPNSEIGVDHYLKKINQQFNLQGTAQLPLNEGASDKAVVK